jgi:hypothetical protein
MLVCGDDILRDGFYARALFRTNASVSPSTKCKRRLSTNRPFRQMTFVGQMHRATRTSRNRERPAQDICLLMGLQ